MQIVDTRPPQAKQENRIFRVIGCTAVYLTSAGALCSMAGLGRMLLGAWGAGTVLLLALCFLPKQAKIQSIVRLSLFLLLGAAVWVLWEPSRDGVCLFLNRLFAVSCSRLISMKSSLFTRRRRNRPAAYRRRQFCSDCCLRSC